MMRCMGVRREFWRGLFRRLENCGITPPAPLIKGGAGDLIRLISARDVTDVLGYS